MALNIKDPETETLARRLARLTGESLTVATRRALEERLKRVGFDGGKPALQEELAAIRQRVKALPVVDARSAEDILGYDRDGLPD